MERPHALGAVRVPGDVTQADVHALRDRGAVVVDTRPVPDACHVELGALPEHTVHVADGPVVVMCGHGERAATGASVLEAAGREGVAILEGGPDDWAAASGEQLEVR
ncbi:MAG: rhodanese-like domain-containing protein [Acidimicrobiales bacterium]|nr:rhodanese-like domain-containing protein [Acidimicrobiales bacterium]